MQEREFQQKEHFPCPPFTSLCIGKELAIKPFFVLFLFPEILKHQDFFFHNCKTLWLRHVLDFLTSPCHFVSQGLKNLTSSPDMFVLVAWTMREGPGKAEAGEEMDRVINQHLNNYYHHMAHTMCQTLGQISQVSLNPANNPWRSEVLSYLADEETAKKWQS